MQLRANPPTFDALELAVLASIADGKTNREIAAGRNVSVHVIATVVKKLKQKLNIETRTELAVRYYESVVGGEYGRKYANVR